MKNIISLMLLVAFANNLYAQAPQAINYQAIARNSAGNPVANQAVGVRFSILKSSSTGVAVYVETHTPTTNALGLFNLQLGKGTASTGTFPSVNWVTSPYFLKVEIDPAGGTTYQVVGTPSEMVSVPYALYAERGPKSTIICDTDKDTYIETEPTPSPNSGQDADQIHMYLGESPTVSAFSPKKVVVLRRNNAGKNTMLEIFDAAGQSNTFIGENVGMANTTGKENTAIGNSALKANTSGDANTAIGVGTLLLNTTGHHNTANGSSALQNNTSGQQNTAVGSNAITSNATGNFNTAIGNEALRMNVANSRSTAIGNNAMFFANDNATPGTNTYNTAVGFEALRGSPTASANTGQSNTAIGDQTLYSNTRGKNNIAIGVKALFANTSGDNNTAMGFEALAVNTIGLANTATGSLSMHNNTTGQYNTVYGAFSMQNNTTGGSNVAIGTGTLDKNVSGNSNTAVGVNALQEYLGSDNTAIGWQSLMKNTAIRNTATGRSSLEQNTIGGFNTANGFEALASNTTGEKNTAVGDQALGSNKTGSANTSQGVGSLLYNTVGGENTATGYFALNVNTTGASNAAIGFAALSNNVSGNRNSALGAGANVMFLNPNVTPISNATAIGSGAIADASDQIRLGDGNVKEVLPGRKCNIANATGTLLGNSIWQWKEVWSCNGMIQPSDSRLKTKIDNINYGINTIMALRPVQYYWKTSPDSNKMLGFIAQEIEKIVPESVVAPKKENEYYAMKYDALIPVLTKAIQEQQAQIEDLKTQNAQLMVLKQQNLSLQTQLNKLQAGLESIQAALEKQPLGKMNESTSNK